MKLILYQATIAVTEIDFEPGPFQITCSDPKYSLQLANARRHGRSLLRWFTQIRGGHEYKPTFSNAGSCSKWGRWGPGEPTPFGKARVSPSRIQTQQHALTPVAGLIGQERDQAFIGNQWEQLQNEQVSQPKHQPATSSRSDAMRWALREYGTVAAESSAFN